MAKKARFRIFKRVTGHGEETLTLPANNQEDILYYFENKDVKIILRYSPMSRPNNHKIKIELG